MAHIPSNSDTQDSFAISFDHFINKLHKAEHYDVSCRNEDNATLKARIDANRTEGFLFPEKDRNQVNELITSLVHSVGDPETHVMIGKLPPIPRSKDRYYSGGVNHSGVKLRLEDIQSTLPKTWLCYELMDAYVALLRESTRSNHDVYIWKYGQFGQQMVQAGLLTGSVMFDEFMCGRFRNVYSVNAPREHYFELSDPEKKNWYFIKLVTKADPNDEEASPVLSELVLVNSSTEENYITDAKQRLYQIFFLASKAYQFFSKWSQTDQLMRIQSC